VDSLNFKGDEKIKTQVIDQNIAICSIDMLFGS
jgi:hypothetical protein